jgi:hypothetical protein
MKSTSRTRSPSAGEDDAPPGLIDEGEVRCRTRADEPVAEPSPARVEGSLADDLEPDDVVASAREVDLEVDHLPALEAREQRRIGHREVHRHRGHQPLDVVVLDQDLAVLAIDVLDDAVRPRDDRSARRPRLSRRMRRGAR